MEEQDVDIMAWAIGTTAVPERWRGEMMDAMRRLDYIPIAR
jgi:antitoxin CptB